MSLNSKILFGLFEMLFHKYIGIIGNKRLSSVIHNLNFQFDRNYSDILQPYHDSLRTHSKKTKNKHLCSATNIKMIHVIEKRR